VLETLDDLQRDELKYKDRQEPCPQTYLPQDSIPIVICERRFTGVYKSHTAYCKKKKEEEEEEEVVVMERAVSNIDSNSSFFSSFCLHFTHIHIRGLFAALEPGILLHCCLHSPYGTRYIACH
jgi:hypothetical protein